MSNSGNYTERTNNTSNLSKYSFQKKNNINNIRKIIIHRNNLNKSLLSTLYNLNKNSNIKYIVPQENKKIILNSLTIKTLSNDFFPNIKEDEKNIKMNDIDLKIKELLERKKTNNLQLKEEEEKKRKINVQELANFYDSIPSLIIKANIEKNKGDKKISIENFYNNYSNIMNHKININKFVNYPIIKYLFLHKILNTITHKVSFVNSSYKYNNIVLNNCNNEEFEKQFKDFITYGYEFIPENLFFKTNNNNDKDFINVITKENGILEKMINNLYFNGKLSTENQNQIAIKYILDESNSNFLNIRNNLLKKMKKKTENKGTMIDKSFKIYNKENYNDDILNIFRKILFIDVNKINKKFQKNEKDINSDVCNDTDIQNENEINIKSFHCRNLKSDFTFFVNKKSRKIKTPNNKIKNKKYLFAIIKTNKRIKSCNFEFEVKNRETQKEEQKLNKKNIIKKEKKNNNLSNLKTIKENRNRYYNLKYHKNKEKQNNIT